MNSILVDIEIRRGKADERSLGLLSQALEAADRGGMRVTAMVLTETADETVLESIRSVGPDQILVLEDKSFADATNSNRVRSLAHALQTAEPGLVLFRSTGRTHDFLGALSVRTGASTIPNALHFSVDESGVHAVCTDDHSRSLLQIDCDAPLVLMSVRSPGRIACMRSTKAEMVRINPPDGDGIPSSVLKARKPFDPLLSRLGDARVVVAAGGGVKDDAGRSLILEFASLIGASIGSTKHAIENGLFPQHTLIGQSGSTVTPDIYFALGISGAIQHVAGMHQSVEIVAINSDPNAAIFDHATLGVVGDITEILPAMIAELKNRGYGSPSAST